MRNLIVILSISFVQIVFGQSNELIESKDQNGYSFAYVENDPFKTRVYTLDNGLTVYLSDYKAKPRIQTYIAVRAGSKNDPSNYTGLAHYLEHIMFKGTSEIGTIDWEEEKVLLEQIESLFEKYGQTSDTAERSKIYSEIDSISYEAAKLTIPNEYDKLLSNIGASGTNAYTWVEQTVYVNNIPKNEIKKWAQIEAERFTEVVPRLFHTELEAVYEEKNRTLDNDGRKSWAAMMKLLFPNHNYGKQTTIGTIDHLKNPSITAIKNYFHKYYIPNNMAICMSGDLDYESTIQLIDDTFGKWKRQELPPAYTYQSFPNRTSSVDTTVYGPDAESLSIAFRFPGTSTKASLLMEYMSMLLSNGQAGFIDLNLNQAQRVLGAYSYPVRMKDYSIHVLGASPKEGQTLEEVKELLLEQVELIREGEFEEWLLEAIINDYKLSQTLESENNKSRADHFVNAFIHDRKWNEYINETSQLEKITKEELVEFAQKHYRDNYVTVFKKTGNDKVLKVQKPKITPVPVNREDQSAFYKEINASPSEQLEPVFINYDHDIKKGSVKNLPVMYSKNVENDLFELFYVFDFGENHDKELALAVSYLNYIGTDKMSAPDLKKEFYKLGCTFDVYSSSDQLYISLTGLNENLSKALPLLENFLANPKPRQRDYDKMVDRILKSRKDKKLSKRAILNQGMVSYAKYGSESPFRDILSADELSRINPESLTDKIKDLHKYAHRVLYYGPEELKSLEKLISKHHKFPNQFKPVPDEKVYKEQDFESNQVIFVDYDMVQAEVVLLSKSVPYDEKLSPVSKLFNEYFGGNMGSIVFQEMRESKALAYSVRSYYSQARRKDFNNYVVSYVGTQADKLEEAINGMQELLNELPHSEPTFENAKSSVLSGIRSSRIIKSSVLFSYEKTKKLGLDYDQRKKQFEFVNEANFADIQAFYDRYIKNQKHTMLVIGDKEKIDLDALTQYGEVNELTLEEIFGY